MHEKNKLTLGMGFLFFFVIVSFGLIIINEKKVSFLLPQIDKKINTYLKTNYENELEKLKINKTKYDLKCNCYKAKVFNKNNKKLFFEITYARKKIKDTYKVNYKQGKTLLGTIENTLTKELQQNKKDNTLKVIIPKTLDEFNPSIREEIINSNDFKNLNIYKIEDEFLITDWNFNTINNSIIDFHKQIIASKFKPISYDFYITNKSNPGESFQITNLKTDYINNQTLNELIPAIKNNNKEILNKYNMQSKN